METNADWDSRKERIVKIISDEGYASVKDLSRKLETSAVTIRKDLDFLEGLGYLERKHGGAVSGKNRQESSELNEHIAREAAKFAKPGNTIILPGGLLNSAIARVLREHGGYTIITNSMVIYELFKNYEHNKIIISGGMYDSSSESLSGRATDEMLKSIRADLFFLEISGLHEEDSSVFCEYSHVHLYLLMMRSSRRSVATLVDDSNHPSSGSTLCQCSELDAIVTNTSVSIDGISIVKV